MAVQGSMARWTVAEPHNRLQGGGEKAWRADRRHNTGASPRPTAECEKPDIDSSGAIYTQFKDRPDRAVVIGIQ